MGSMVAGTDSAQTVCPGTGRLETPRPSDTAPSRQGSTPWTARGSFGPGARNSRLTMYLLFYAQSRTVVRRPPCGGVAEAKKHTSFGWNGWRRGPAMPEWVDMPPRAGPGAHVSPSCRVGQANRTHGGASIAETSYARQQNVTWPLIGLRSPTKDLRRPRPTLLVLRHMRELGLACSSICGMLWRTKEGSHGEEVYRSVNR